MKAYLIDPVNKQVTEVATSGKLRNDRGFPGIYALTQCQCVDIVRIGEEGDHVFVDDDGLLNGAPHRIGMFMLTGTARSIPLAGYGLWLGSKGEDEGEPKYTLAEVQAMVTFPSLLEIQTMAAAGKFD